VQRAGIFYNHLDSAAMTNTYPKPVPEPDDESAEAMTRPPDADPTLDLPVNPGAQAVPARNTRRRVRNLFWPGFVLGFILLGVASCGGIALATGLSRIGLETLQNSGPAWTPPPVTPTSVETPVAEAQAPSVGEAGGAFTQGQQLNNITASQVNIRAEPGYLSKPAGDVIGQVPPGGRVEVIGGRTLADDLTWWYVRYTTPNGTTIDGWIAEATASGVQILGQ
jgi:hypothetical protein